MSDFANMQGASVGSWTQCGWWNSIACSLRAPGKSWPATVMLLAAALLSVALPTASAQAPRTADDLAKPPPLKSMRADADPTFDVATIKPNNSGAANVKMLRFGVNDFEARNASLVDLIAFAFQVQATQITGPPEWMAHDRYDIKARPDIEGVPNAAQCRSLVRKLLADRYQLIFHSDRKEMPAYVMTVVPGGSKLTPTEFHGPGMSFGFVPKPEGVWLPMRNATMADLSAVLQSMVLDRPVVNSTGLTGRYDFAVTFLADDSQFNGHPPKADDSAPKSEPAPNLFDAMRQQLGLRLEAKRAAVDVIAIDHVEKPSAN